MDDSTELTIETLVDLIRLPVPIGSTRWKERARCAPMPKEWWFPPDAIQRNTMEYKRLVIKAKAVCKMCPVRADCLEYALANNEASGVWGGLTQSERERLRYQKRATRPDGSIYEYPTIEVMA